MLPFNVLIRSGKRHWRSRYVWKSVIIWACLLGSSSALRLGASGSPRTEAQLTGQHARQLQYFVSDSIYPHVQGSQIFGVENQAKYSLVGNVSQAQYGNGDFVASPNLSGPEFVTVSNGSWWYSPSFSQSDCATVLFEAGAPVDVFVITTRAFNLLVSQFQQHPDSVSASLIQPPNAAGGQAVWMNAASRNFTAQLNRSESYSVALLNLNPESISVTIALDVSTAVDPVCADFLAEQGAEPPPTTNLFQELGMYSYLGRQSLDSYLGFTGVSCIAFGIAYRNGSQGNTNDLTLDTDITSTDIPTPIAGLNTTIFVLSTSELQVWGRDAFPSPPSTSSTCTITNAFPGPCFAVAAGLDPQETYTIWTAQAGLASDVNVDGLPPQYWTWQVASASTENICHEIWPVTQPAPAYPPGPPPIPPGPPQVPSNMRFNAGAPTLKGFSTQNGGSESPGHSSGSANNTAAIVGGAVGGSVGAGIILLVGGLLLRRHNQKLRQKDPSSKSLMSDVGTSIYSGSTANESRRSQSASCLSFPSSYIDDLHHEPHDSVGNRSAQLGDFQQHPGPKAFQTQKLPGAVELSGAFRRPRNAG